MVGWVLGSKFGVALGGPYAVSCSLCCQNELSDCCPGRPEEKACVFLEEFDGGVRGEWGEGGVRVKGVSIPF